MEQESANFLILIGTLGGALVGAFIGGVSTWVNSYLTKKADEKRQFREIVMKFAIEDWKTRIEHGKSGSVRPLAEFIVYAYKISELIFENKVTEAKIEKAYGEIDKLIETMRKFPPPKV